LNDIQLNLYVEVGAILCAFKSRSFATRAFRALRSG